MTKLFGDDKRVRFFIGGVSDKDRLVPRLNVIDYVIQVAATKIMRPWSTNLFEFVKTNVFGSMKLIDAFIDLYVRFVVALSKDKASSQTNRYGDCCVVLRLSNSKPSCIYA